MSFNLRRLVLKVSIPLTKIIGKLHLSPSHRLCLAAQYDEVYEDIEPGDVLISYMRGELSSLGIPGYWTHAAIYVGGNEVVEAIGEGVIRKDLRDFVMSKDNVCVLRPTFQPFSNEILKERAIAIACELAKHCVGKEYDYAFEPNEKAFYCSELVAYCLQKACTDLLQVHCEFTTRKTLGVETVVAQDFYNAKSKFAIVYQAFA